MLSISYGADEHYRTTAVPGTVAYENAVQIVASKRRLVNLYAFNSSNATVYLMLRDTSNAGTDNGPIVGIFPLFAGSFISIGIHGGDRFENGVYVKAFTDNQLSVAAGNVLFYKSDYMAYL